MRGFREKCRKLNLESKRDNRTHERGVSSGENGGRILRGSGKYITRIFIIPSEVSVIAYNL